jgi:tetratricopeptide (TPR) repeat protein
MQVAAFCVATPGFAKEFDEVIRKLHAVLPLYLDAFPAADNSYYRLAFALATAHREQEAAELVHQAALSAKRITDPATAANTLYYAALMQLRLGDKAGYRATCKALVELPVDKLLGITKSRPIWTPCLAPDALDDSTLLVKRAEKLVASISLNERHFGLYVWGAALYRAGQYEQAAQRLEESIAAYPSGPERGDDTVNYQQLLLAMTQWQLGQRDTARQLLAETLPAIDKELDSPSTSWNRRATLEILRREAAALIGRKVTDGS